MATLSVIIPNYNHRHFLERAVEAIVNQTRPPDEIIIIDDASTDDSWSLIGQLKARYANLRGERNPVNLGVNGTLNRGTELAKGDFVHYPGADDVIAPDLYERAMSLLESHPEAGLCSTLSVAIDENDHFRGLFPSPIVASEPAYFDPAQAGRLILRHESWFMGNVVIYRRQAQIDAGGYRKELGSFGDGFLCRVLAARHGACFVPAPLGAWRRMEQGYSSVQGRNITWQLSVIPLVEQLMTGAFAGVFPSGYLRRWQGRWRFSTIRMALRLPENRAEMVLAALDRPSWFDRLMVSLLTRCGRLGTIGLTLYLFLLLRGGDLFDIGVLHLRIWRLNRDPEFTRYWRRWSEARCRGA